MPAATAARAVTKPLPDPTIVKRADLKTIDQLFTGFYLSHKVGIDTTDRRIHDGADLGEAEGQAIDDAIAALQPGMKLEVYLNRYEVGLKKNTDRFKKLKAAAKAKKVKLTIKINTDSNVIFESPTLEKGTAHTSDFAHAKVNSSNLGEVYTDLRKSGWELGNAKGGNGR